MKTSSDANHQKMIRHPSSANSGLGSFQPEPGAAELVLWLICKAEPPNNQLCQKKAVFLSSILMHGFPHPKIIFWEAPALPKVGHRHRRQTVKLKFSFLLFHHLVISTNATNTIKVDDKTFNRDPGCPGCLQFHDPSVFPESRDTS